MTKPWPMVPLGEVLKKSEEWTDLKPEETYREVTVRLWGKGVVLRREVTGAEIAAPRRFVVKRQQFILSRIDARNGAFGLIPNSLDKAVVSNDFPVFNLNTQRIEPKFLEWMSKTHDFVELCKAASEGTTNRVRLKEERFIASQIPLPPLFEQKRIVARVEELAAKIEEAKGMRQKAVQEAEALNSGLYRKVFDETEEEFSNYKKLEDVVTILGGGTPSKHNFAYWNGGIPWVSPKDMKVSDIFDSEDHLTQFALSTNAATLIPENAILVVVRSGILRRTIPVAINRVPVTINQDMKALLPRSELLPEYLRWWFRGKEASLLECVKGGTTVQSLVWEKVKSSAIFLPPLPEQHRIVAYLDDLQAKVDSLKRLQVETAVELNAMLPSVLDRAFKGEL